MTASRDLLRSGMVVTELALAVVLLVGAGLMISSVGRLRNVDKGFEPASVVTARVRLPRPAFDDFAHWQAFYRDGLERLRAEPGVQSVAAALLVPLSQRSWERGVWPEGVPPTHGTGQSVLYNVVTPEYFETMGVTIVRGRPFTPADREGAPPVAVIDESMARLFWPGQDPIGKRITLERTMGAHDGDPIYRTVIGVAKNVRHYNLANPSRIQAYVSWTQLLMPYNPELAFIVRGAAPGRAMVAALRRIIPELNQDVAIADVRSATEYVEAGLSPTRALSDLLTAFGAVALLLAGVGVFGVMSSTVAQRTREIGIRMALGATRGQVLGSVTGRALLLGIVGVAIGGAAAAALSRLLKGMLYQVSPVDFKVYGVVGLLLLGAAVIAAFLPARRAAGVDPVEALRAE